MAAEHIPNCATFYTTPSAVPCIIVLHNSLFLRCMELHLLWWGLHWVRTWSCWVEHFDAVRVCHQRGCLRVQRRHPD